MGRGKEAGQGSVSWKGWKSGVEMQPEIIQVPPGRFPAQAHAPGPGPASPGGGNIHTNSPAHGEHPIQEFSQKSAEQGDAASFRI